MTIASASNTSAPLIVVVGGTGNKGGSVLRALIDSNTPYRLRTITRDRTKRAAVALQEKGVEVVQTSLNVGNEAGARKAFEGADVVFLVTAFWEHGSKQREIDEGVMLVDAAKACNVKLLIWSGLENASEVSHGKYTRVSHFDSKAAITAHARECAIPFVDVQCGVHAQNWHNWRYFKKHPDGTHVIPLPCSPETIMPIIDVNDYGLFVQRVIEDFYNGTLEIGSAVYTYGEFITYAEMVRQLAELTGKKVRFQQVTPEEFMGASPEEYRHANEELAQMYQFFDEFGMYGAKEIESLAGLARRPKTWAEFVSSNLDIWANSEPRA